MSKPVVYPLVSPAALKAARRKLSYWRDNGASYYWIGKTLGRPAGTVRAWCLGGGINADDVEKILDRRIVIYQYLGKRTRKPYWRPCLDSGLSAHFTAAEVNQHLRALVRSKREALGITQKIE